MLKVLVIEDEKYLRDILKDVLKYFGLKVYTAGNKIDALKMIKKLDFNFIMLDQFLPDTTPANWEKTIKNLALNKPVVLMSGFNQNQNNFFKINHFAYLNKPFGVKEIANLINKIKNKCNFKT